MLSVIPIQKSQSCYILINVQKEIEKIYFYIMYVNRNRKIYKIMIKCSKIFKESKQIYKVVKKASKTVCGARKFL